MIALLIKASLVIIVLLAFYKIFLEKESFYAVNRMYLLGCLFAAFTLPFLCLPQLIEQQGIVSTLMEKSNSETFSASPNEVFLSKNKSNENSIQEINNEIPAKEALQKNEPTIPEKTETTVATNPMEQQQSVETPAKVATPPAVPTTKGIGYWLLLIYFFGVVVLSFNLIAQVVSTLLKVAKNKDQIEDEDGTIVNMTTEIEPCSFFKFIFINPSSYDYETYEQILAHEKIHVKQMHSVDLLLSELAVIALWFNPFVWKMRTEVEKNIEYQTDDLLINNEPEEKEEYQLNLVKIATYTKPLMITTNYNQSLIKQRILKMNTKKSNPYGYWKYAFIAPLVFVIVLFLNKPITSFAQNENSISSIDGNIEQPTSSNIQSEESQEIENTTNEISTDLVESVPEENDLTSDDGKTDCEKLLNAAKKENVKKVRKLLIKFDPSCMPNATNQDFDNMNYVKFLAENKGKILIDNYREQIIVEGSVIGLANHDYDLGDDFGNRISGDCKELMIAIQLEDGERVKDLLINLDKKCILDIDDPKELADFELTKTILKSGATIEFHKSKVFIDYDELTRMTTTKTSTNNGSNTRITKKSNESNFDSDCKKLIDAVKANNIARVQELLKTMDSNCMDRNPGFEEIEEIDKGGETITYGRLAAKTPLVAAARKGNFEIGKVLIDAGAKVNFHDRNNDTPLMAAAESGNLDFVKLLLSKGADINENSQGFGTALNAASRNGHSEIAKYLIDQGANVNIKNDGSGSALVMAAGNGELETVKHLLESGAKINSQTNGQGSALVRAAGNGELEVVKYLLSQGASIDASTNGQGSALSTAAGNGELEVVKYLLSQGANINEANDGQGSALSRAAGNGEMQIVEYLLSQGADIDRMTNGSGSALTKAAQNGEINLVKFLVSKGADVNASIPGHGSALIQATKNNEYEIVKFLLENKADPWASPPGHDAPIVIARKMRDKRFYELFKKYE